MVNRKLLKSKLRKLKNACIYKWVNSGKMVFWSELLQTSSSGPQLSDFQIRFSIIRIFLRKILKEYHFQSTFFDIDIIWKLQFLKHFIFLKMSPIFVGSETIHIKKTFSLSLLIYIHLPCVKRSSWSATTLETLTYGVVLFWMHHLLITFEGLSAAYFCQFIHAPPGTISPLICTLRSDLKGTL